ncbi:MAG TPA: hypothetical protein VG407_08565 [Caulobacteraceae bacterium]|jgi:hypothetical protein|nr:hypothetical protein [Caulobacteraceae bacterium]
MGIGTAVAAIATVTLLQFTVAALCWGFVPAFIAKSKGRKDFWVWWVYGVFLLPIAVIHALIMKSDQSAMDEKALPKPPA